MKTDGNASYAKVKRNKADLGAVVSEALKNSTTLKADGIMSAALLLKQAVLALLQQGHAVDVLNVGTSYLTASGNIEGDNPSISDIPEISITFSPSDEAKAAVKDVVVDSASSEESEPVINKVQDNLESIKTSVFIDDFENAMFSVLLFSGLKTRWQSLKHDLMLVLEIASLLSKLTAQ